MAKTILQGRAKGGRRQGRQGKRWEDNIRKWTGLEFAKSPRAVENREKWRKMVVKSSVAPQQHQGMDRPRVREVLEGSGKQRKMEDTVHTKTPSMHRRLGNANLSLGRNPFGIIQL